MATGSRPLARRSERLSTTYVDTADLRIARWGSSLRHRKGEGWTVKLPAAGENGSLLSRKEHVFDGEDPGKLPVAAARPRPGVRPGGAELAPVARLQTKRTAVELKDELGRSVAQVTDDEVSVMDGPGWVRASARSRSSSTRDARRRRRGARRALREAGAGPWRTSPSCGAPSGRRRGRPDVVIDELGGT